MINFKDYCKDDYRRKVKKAFEDDNIYTTENFVIADRFMVNDSLSVIIKRKASDTIICNATIKDVYSAYMNSLLNVQEVSEITKAFKQHTELCYRY